MDVCARVRRAPPFGATAAGGLRKTPARVRDGGREPRALSSVLVAVWSRLQEHRLQLLGAQVADDCGTHNW